MVQRFKLLFLGPGGVGKTSVIKRLNGARFKSGLAATDGVEVVPMILEKRDRLRSEVNEVECLVKFIPVLILYTML